MKDGNLRALLRHEVWVERPEVEAIEGNPTRPRYVRENTARRALVQPLMAMLVFSVIFGRLVRVPTDGIPYPIFAFCGLLPWQLFSSAFNSRPTRCLAI